MVNDIAAHLVVLNTTGSKGREAVTRIPFDAIDGARSEVVRFSKEHGQRAGGGGTVTASQYKGTRRVSLASCPSKRHQHVEMRGNPWGNNLRTYFPRDCG